MKKFQKVTIISLTYQQLLLNGLADLVEEGEGGLVLAHHHQVHGPVPCYMLLIAVTCYWLLLHVIDCCYMLLIAITCYWLLLHVIDCTQISFTAVWVASIGNILLYSGSTVVDPEILLSDPDPHPVILNCVSGSRSRRPIILYFVQIFEK